MINGSIINNLLKSILGTKNPINTDSRTNNVGYICLGYEITKTADNDIETFIEPDDIIENSGYHRYLIGAYDYNSGTTSRLANKVEVQGGEAYNTDTLYFDEALKDWTTDERKIRYFGIANSATATPIAYGYIINDQGEHITLDVKQGQVPIIRKEQLQLSIQDLEDLPTKDYFAKVSYQAEGAPTPTILYKLKLKTTNIEKVVNNILYTQVVITNLEVINEQGVVTVVTLNEGDVLFIANIRQIVDQETLVNFYDNNLTIYPEVKIQVFSTDPDQE